MNSNYQSMGKFIPGKSYLDNSKMNEKMAEAETMNEKLDVHEESLLNYLNKPGIFGKSKGQKIVESEQREQYKVIKQMETERLKESGRHKLKTIETMNKYTEKALQQKTNENLIHQGLKSYDRLEKSKIEALNSIITSHRDPELLESISTLSDEEQINIQSQLVESRAMFLGRADRLLGKHLDIIDGGE